MLLSLVVVMIRTSIFCIDKDTYTRSQQIKTNFATKRIEWCSKVLKKLVISAYKSQWSVHIKIFYVNYMAVERWFIWRFDCYFYMFSFCSLFFGPLKWKKRESDNGVPKNKHPGWKWQIHSWQNCAQMVKWCFN